jgi:hypothetical protein
MWKHSGLCWLAVVAVTLLGCLAAPAFDGDRVTIGPLTLTIAKMETVREREKPQEVTVSLTSAGKESLAIQLELKGLVDDCRAVGQARRTIKVDPGQTAQASFAIQFGKGCYSALYPVHVEAAWEEAGKPVKAQAVAIIRTDFGPSLQPEDNQAAAITPVPTLGAVDLTQLRNQRVSWAYLGKEPVVLPPGWQGRDERSLAVCQPQKVARGGETRQALHMHPPYRPSAGTIFAEYRLQLPRTQPLRFSFFNAIRDHGPREPASDGVTFRVWVNDQKRFERHLDAKTWTGGEVDLTPFAGQVIRLRLESHPGPKGNTTCDSCYWGDPIVSAGTGPKQLGVEAKRALAEQARKAVTTGTSTESNVFTVALDSGCRAALALGPNGLLDGVLAFGSTGSPVTFEGLQATILDQAAGRWPSPLMTEKVSWVQEDGRLRVIHRLRLGDDAFDLTAVAWKEGPGLRLAISCPRRITDLAIGRADQKADQVYFGHGYCVVEPGSFRIAAGGHGLAASHVGFTFHKGLSLLLASDTPPEYLAVDPANKLYTLHVHPDATFTFVPSSAGAIDAALRYRPLSEKRASAGVKRMAGRFVFDYWGGRYADDAALMRRAFSYGLTDALLIMHVWQRWGYDYRLPDIYPPDQRLGTLQDLQVLGRACAERGVLFGLHDNYIDFYPDADDFSYEHITFDRTGQPRPAWLNHGRNAQSYQFRPDHVLPFLKRNLQLLTPTLRPTAYFVDVFASAPPFDYYDRQGAFHSRRETQQYWSKAFDTIRATLGHDAPTISEAGGDYLIGHLDGADCQFLHLSPLPDAFNLHVPCQDWERVPWYDAVHHGRFSLHGVGYSDRYQGGRSRSLYGIESDSYIGAEVLTGHALMIDLTAGLRGAVRKYWLAQDIARRLALDQVVSVAYANGNIHRQVITWKSGMKVHVNRGLDNWTVAGRTLPPFGYLARSDEVESSIELIDGTVAEQARNKGTFYVNGRGLQHDPPLRLCPVVERLEPAGPRSFRLPILWRAERPAPKDLSVFVHFCRKDSWFWSPYRIIFQGDHGRPQTPTSQWQGEVVTGSQTTVAIPEEVLPGRYEIFAGLNDPAARPQRRYRLLGEEDRERRYRLGTLVIEGTAAKITALRLEKVEPSPLLSRLLPSERDTDFGLVRTRGALRCQAAPDHLLVTPLPDSDSFALCLRLEKIVGRPVRVTTVEAVDTEGRATRAISFRADAAGVEFTTSREDFSYRVRFQPALPSGAAGVLQAFLDESLPGGGIDRTRSLWQAPGRGAASGSDMFPGKIDPRYLRYLIEIMYRLANDQDRPAWVKIADAHVGYLVSAVKKTHPTWVLGNTLEAIGLHHAHHGGKSPYAARVMEIITWLRERRVEVRLPDGTTFGHFPCGYGVMKAKDAGWTNDLSMAGAGLVWAYEVTGDKSILADAVGFAEYFVRPWRLKALGKHGYWECGTWREEQGCWVIGPSHYTGFESTDLFADESSWVFSNLTCADFLMRLFRHRPDPRYVDRCVKAAQWTFRECQFPDGAVGMCGRDDKWLGFSGAAVSIVAMVAPHLKAGDERAGLLRAASRAKAYLDAGLEKANVKTHGVEWVTRKSSTDPLVNVGMVWTYGLLGWNDSWTLPVK